MGDKKVVTLVYTNWKGETKERHVIPERVYWGHTEWHKEDQFLMECFDLNKQAKRTYALNCVKKWTPVGGKAVFEF